jgi:hypothetical protein
MRSAILNERDRDTRKKSNLLLQRRRLRWKVGSCVNFSVLHNFFVAKPLTYSIAVVKFTFSLPLDQTDHSLAATRYGRSNSLRLTVPTSSLYSRVYMHFLFIKNCF